MREVWIERPRSGDVARAAVATLDDVEAIERVPLEALMPRWTTHAAIGLQAAQRPDAVALQLLDSVDPSRVSRTLSFSELHASITAFANCARESSHGRPAVVAILAPLVPEALIALWGACTAGIASPINPFLRREHIAAIMNASRATILVTTRALSQGQGPLPEDWICAHVPTLTAVWYVDDDGPAAVARRCALGRSDVLDFEEGGAHTTCALLHTGGTTAAPKLVEHTQRGQLLNAWNSGAFLGADSREVVALGLPYFHAAGANVVALRAMVFGQRLLLMSAEGFRNATVVREFWNLLDEFHVTSLMTTPTTAAAVVASPAAHPPRVAPKFFTGGSALPLQVARDCVDRLGVNLHQLWGMTELHGAVLAVPWRAPNEIGSVGFRFPHHRLRVVAAGDAAIDVERADGALQGVLCVQGACVTRGYWGAAAATASLFRAGSADDASRWLDTGDLCRIDARGYVTLRGRSKDVIIRGGHNIDPAVIEEALAAHPAVLLAAAIGEPDRAKGELPVAYVQLRSNASASPDELLSHCRDCIAERAAVPREIRIVEVMPVTAVGKIFKPALRRDAVERLARALLEGLGVCDVARRVDVRESGSEFILRIRCPARALDEVRRACDAYPITTEFVTDGENEGAAP